MSGNVLTLLADRAPLVIGATGMDAIRQNIRIIVITLCGSVPLDRAFAHDGRFIDSPAPYHTARMSAALVRAIEKYEPRVKVQKLEFVNADKENQILEGVLTPKITFSIRAGVEI